LPASGAQSGRFGSSFSANSASTGSLGRRVGERGPNPVPAAKQLVVVAHVLVTQGDADDALPDQGRERVHHLVPLALIDEARGHPLDQPERAIGVPQQQPAAGRSHGAAIERRHHPPPAKAFKLELFRATLCRHRGTPLRCVKPLSQKSYRASRAPMHLLG
jgi:hypothetical protein